jgi:septation ring formation regulator EzrA
MPIDFQAPEIEWRKLLMGELQAIEERLKNVESSQAELKTDLQNLRQEMLTQEDEGADGPLLPLL